MNSLIKANPATLNMGIDREIDDLPPGLDRLLLSQSTGDGYPGRRNASPRPADDQAASYFADHDYFQAYPTASPTSFERPGDIMEVTGSVKGRYRVKAADNLDYSGLFTTDQLDPRMPESQQNLLNQPFITGMGATQDQAVSKMFDDLRAMSNTSTMNSQGDSTANAPETAKEAAVRARLDARRRYANWR